MNIESLVEANQNPNIPRLTPGDVVKVGVKVAEGDRVRTQMFQGVVIGVRHGITGSFTVRHVAYGVGVERTFPLVSPSLEKVEIVRRGKVRRAKLFYLRGLSGRAARIKEKRTLEKMGDIPTGQAEEPLPATAEEQAPVQAEAQQPSTEAAENKE